MVAEMTQAAMPARPLPLSHPVRVEDVKLRGTRIVVTAPAAVFNTIAAELGLASIEALEGRYELVRKGETVKLDGVISARLHQTCVVTLEAFPVALEAPLQLDFAPTQMSRPEARRAETDGAIDVEIGLHEDDPPEPIVDGVIDLGAVTLEFLALALDPYPRKPGVSFDAGPADAGIESPFAALARLKRGE